MTKGTDWDNYIEVVSKNEYVQYKRIKKIAVMHGREKWVGGVYDKGSIYGIANCSNCVLKRIQ